MGAWGLYARLSILRQDSIRGTASKCHHGVEAGEMGKDIAARWGVGDLG